MFKKKLKILARDDSLNLKAFPGDTFEIVHERHHIDSDGNIIRKEYETVLIEKITKCMIINSAVAFELENILGLKRGIGGAFGEKDEI